MIWPLPRGGEHQDGAHGGWDREQGNHHCGHERVLRAECAEIGRDDEVVRHPDDAAYEQHPWRPPRTAARREPGNTEERRRHRHHLRAHAEHSVDEELVELRVVLVELRVRRAEHVFLGAAPEEDGPISDPPDRPGLERDRHNDG